LRRNEKFGLKEIGFNSRPVSIPSCQNHNLVLIARPEFIDFNCFVPKIGGLNIAGWSKYLVDKQQSL